jgi:hypothetical protein
MFTKSVLRFVSALALFSILIQGAVFDVKTAAAGGYCDWAQYVSDVTIPDGTNFTAGTAFTKTWRLKNIGTCTWTTSYGFVFSSGVQMGGTVSVALPYPVSPGQTVDISVPLVAPLSEGSYRGFWKLVNENGTIFGIGSYANGAVWVDIRVSLPVFPIYDFATDICSATWVYNGGAVPCPYKPAMARYGQALRYDSAILETGLPSGVPTILTIPQQNYNGYIRGVYPYFGLTPGDRFQATYGCEYGAANCLVTFQLEYMTDKKELVTIWKAKEKYDGMMGFVDIDLSRYSYKPGIRLVLAVSATGTHFGDRPLWVNPKIVHPVPVNFPTATIPPTPTITFTPTVTFTPTITPTITLTPTATLTPTTTFTPTSTFTPTPLPGYNFITNACSATWQSAAGGLPCFGTDGDTRGFVLNPSAPILENGQTPNGPVLLTFPENSSNGYIRGEYPGYVVQKGDHFKATLSCENNQLDCNTMYEIDYQIGSGPWQALGIFVERYDGQITVVDLDINYFTGQVVRFSLSTSANGSSSGDRALWIAPRIVNVP